MHVPKPVGAAQGSLVDVEADPDGAEPPAEGEAVPASKGSAKKGGDDSCDNSSSVIITSEHIFLTISSAF